MSVQTSCSKNVFSFYFCLLLCNVLCIQTLANASVQSKPSPTPTMTPSWTMLVNHSHVHPMQSSIKTILIDVEPVSENVETVTFSLDNGAGVLGYEMEIAYIANTTSIIEGSFQQLLPDSPFITFSQKTGLWKVTVASLTKVQSNEKVDLFSIQVQRNPGISPDIPIRLFLTNNTAINKGEFALQVELPVVLFQQTGNTNPTATSTHTVPAGNTPGITPIITPTFTPVNSSPNARILTASIEEISATVKQISIVINNAVDVLSYSFEFTFDPAAIAYVNGSLRHLLSNQPFGIANPQNGSLRIAGTSGSAVTVNGTQTMITFQVEKLSTAPADHPVEMTITNRSNVNDGFIPVSYISVFTVFQIPGVTPTIPVPSPTRGNFPTVTPTFTAVPTATSTPLPRNLTFQVDEVSARVQKVTVGIDNALAISVFRIEFSFQASLLKYVDGSFQNLLFNSAPLITNTGNGILRFVSASAANSTETGPRPLFSFLIERSTVSPDVIPIEMMITTNTSINANAFSLIYNPTILLFEDYTGVPIEPTATPTLTPSHTPTATVTFTPTNTPVIINTPTHTPTIPTPAGRKIDVKVEDVSDTRQKVTVGIENGLDIIGYRFEFTFDSEAARFVEGTYKNLLPGSFFPLVTIREGTLIFLSAGNFSVSQTGEQNILSFEIERVNNSMDDMPIEIMISERSSINDGEIRIQFNPIITLFDDGFNNTTPTPVSVTTLFEFEQSSLAANGWSEIPGGFIGAVPGVILPNFDLKNTITSSLDKKGLSIIVNPMSVAFIYATQPIETNGNPVLIRLTARSIGGNAALALGALKGSLKTGENLDGSIVTNIPAETTAISSKEGRYALLFQPGQVSTFTPFIQAAATSNENHETIFIDKLEIIELDKTTFGLFP